MAKDLEIKKDFKILLVCESSSVMSNIAFFVKLYDSSQKMKTDSESFRPQYAFGLRIASRATKLKIVY